MLPVVSQWRPVWFLLRRMNAIRQGGNKNYKPFSLNNQLYSEKSLIFVSLFPLLFESCQPQSLILLQSFFYYYHLSIFIRHYHWTFLWLEFQWLMQFPMPSQASELLQPCEFFPYWAAQLSSSCHVNIDTGRLEASHRNIHTYLLLET